MILLLLHFYLTLLDCHCWTPLEIQSEVEGMSDSQSLGLIPSARDLYFILHDILWSDYKLIPQLYSIEDGHCLDCKKNKPYHTVLYKLACLYFDESERNQLNLEKMISAGIAVNESLQFLKDNSIIDHIIREIATFNNTKPFQFDKSVLSENELEQLTFNDRLNTVSFDNSRRDFMNIIGDEHVFEGDYNDECRIDTFVLGRGDEMWIGTVSKSIYSPYSFVEHSQKALFYYYGGRIQAFGHHAWEYLGQTKAYDKYDWISMIVNKKWNTMTFYRNKHKITEIGPLFEVDDLVYNGVLDYRNDGFFVEKVLFGSHA